MVTSAIVGPWALRAAKERADPFPTGCAPPCKIRETGRARLILRRFVVRLTARRSDMALIFRRAALLAGTALLVDDRGIVRQAFDKVIGAALGDGLGGVWHVVTE